MPWTAISRALAIAARIDTAIPRDQDHRFAPKKPIPQRIARPPTTKVALPMNARNRVPLLAAVEINRAPPSTKPIPTIVAKRVKT